MIRLLKLHPSGKLALHTFAPGRLPPYAILSHLEGTDEVDFTDIEAGTGESKAGHRKIIWCAERAAHDDLDYFWVNTCCIDRRSSSQVSDAINSMFRWVSDAIKCYVYLSDVTTNGKSSDIEQDPWLRESFVNSKWFNYGWTLQELLGPAEVEFYSLQGCLLGTKRSLDRVIEEITKVPRAALHMRSFDNFSVAERLSWVSNRKTARIEDRAYCLLGLFGVTMPVAYGEGDLAFERLQRKIMALRNQTSGLRLINVQTNPLSIETFPKHATPPYAILSHTWAKEEVTFQDVLLGRASTKTGYDKIIHSCKFAAHQGLGYLWVDTCCIDKSSSAELQEAICSMFAWYRDAQMCFVYLEDYDIYSASSQLSACRWFKRGWTLQELIAPARLYFYDYTYNPVGTKASLCQQIAEITGIDSMILRGASPLNRTVAERMSWASGRSTTRIEDAAYSLMGLFNVFIPMLYGEGEQAFLRLQEEIMKRSEDHTLFAWRATSIGTTPLLQPNRARYRGLFARSPLNFKQLANTSGATQVDVRRFHHYRPPDQLFFNPASVTSRGVLIALPLRKIVLDAKEDLGFRWAPEVNEVPHPPSASYASLSPAKAQDYLAVLCSENSLDPKNDRILCITLRQHANGIFSRRFPGLTVILPANQAERFRTRSIYVVSSGSFESRTPSISSKKLMRPKARL